MIFFTVLLGLLSERFLIHTQSTCRFSWFAGYLKWQQSKERIAKLCTSPWLTLSLLMLPPLGLVALVLWLTGHWIFGLMGFFLHLVIFTYCLGPENPFYPLNQDKPDQGEYFFWVNRTLFSVIFWYALTGPLGVLLYRMITLCQSFEPVAEAAISVTNILEWIPARLTALLYLVVGNFEKGLPVVKRYILAEPALNAAFLSSAGLEATILAEDALPYNVVAEKLVAHATLVILAVIALFTLMA